MRWEQILVRGFLLDEKMKVEGIEALIFPAEDCSDKSEDHFQKIIEEVNHELKSYQKIHRLKVLDEPMEMTTTRKIKRFAVKE